ncbi:hypothetical protein ACFL0I_02335 [Gemmatimonadota bacterium]
MTPVPSPFQRAAYCLLVFVLAACSGAEAPVTDGLMEGEFAHLELEVAYPEAFSFLNGVREQADGTVMAADPLSQVVLRLDLEAGTADTLGRVGEGPEEYMQPDQVFPLPGDSTLIVDLGKTQLTVMDPEGAFHTGMKMASFADDGRVSIILPRFLDRAGRIYFTAGRGMGEGPPDSTLVARFDRVTGETEEMGWVWRPEPIVTRSGQNVRRMSVQMEGRDDWAAGPDGQFAIVRANGYVVEWRYPDGRVVTGLPNPVETTTIRDEDKLTFLEQRNSSGLMTMMSLSPGGATEMSMSRGGGGRALGTPDLGEYQWAEEYAAFRPDRSRVAPDGQLWVERWLPPDENPVMDVFDGDGVKLGTVELPSRRELIGFGQTADGAPAVYLVRTDEYDLKWLERYHLIR